MGRVRGFLLKHRVTTVCRRVFRRNCHRRAYRRLNSIQSSQTKPFSSLISWTHRLRKKAKAIVSEKFDSRRGYIRSGQEPEVLDKPGSVPKGHMAVYVGQRDGDFQRVLVPVVYFNHPLFGDLLKESEKEYGFNHPGGITIPCRVSEFERVQTRIEAVRSPRKVLTWKRFNKFLMN